MKYSEKLSSACSSKLLVNNCNPNGKPLLLLPAGSEIAAEEEDVLAYRLKPPGDVWSHHVVALGPVGSPVADFMAARPHETDLRSKLG